MGRTNRAGKLLCILLSEEAPYGRGNSLAVHRIARSRYLYRSVITPRAHAQQGVKQSSVNTKIAGSRVLGI
jgi:hypothetical protein